MAARRRSALAAFAAEYGERGIEAVGGRRAAERLLAAEEPAADVPSLVELLERRAAGSAAGAEVEAR